MMNVETPLPDDLGQEVSVTPPTDPLTHQFTYHSPTAETIPKYKELREKGLDFARVIDNLCPNGPDKSAAIRKVREAVMTANAAIACGGQGPYRVGM